MTGRTALFLLLALLAAPRGARADDEPAGSVTLSVASPVVTVPGVARGRYFVDLPALEYAFEVAAECAGGSAPHSLSINVADTRVTMSAADFEKPPPRQLVLRVPAKQTAPLAVDDFCERDPEAEGPASGTGEMRFGPPGGTAMATLIEVPDVLSAQVALVCSSGEARRTTYVSQPLGVTLSCELPARPAAGAPRPDDR